MKLTRYGNIGNEKPGIIDDTNQRRSVVDKFTDWNYDFFSSGGLEQLKIFLENNISDLPLIPDTERWASPIARPGKVVCIGLNYKDHAAETKMEIPKEPIIFLKAANTVVGAYDNIIIPKKSIKTDWEAELAVIIKKDARYLSSPDDSKNYIAGYTIGNDVSEREFQFEHGGQWTKGKSADNFNPVGPYLLTADENIDEQNLSVTSIVNGKVMQHSNTKNMIFDVDFLVYYVSQFMTLEAGDLILTGSPPGVALGMKEPAYLKQNDVVEVEIEKLGYQKQVCINA